MQQQSVHVPARQPTVPVSPLFVNRWSPRAFRPEAVPRPVLEAMVEAARWAPSSGNLQPWRFHIASRGDEVRAAWDEAVGPGNRVWSDKAPVLVWVVARRTMGPNPWAPPETPNGHAWFDTGMATLSFILEGERQGVKSHPIGGIDAKRAHGLLGLDEDHDVVAALVVGYPADASTLPDSLRARETPSGRKPASEVGVFA